MQCLQAPAAAACSDLSVLERQIARLNWQQQQQQQQQLQRRQQQQQQQQQQLANGYIVHSSGGGYDLEDLIPLSTSAPAFQYNHGEQISNGPSTAGWPELAGPSIRANIAQEDVRATEESLSSCSSKKRRADNSPKPLKQQENNSKGTEVDTGKRIKEGIERAAVPESNCKPITDNNKDVSGDTSKDNTKTQKTDYIHVRSRRGQATDSHSLAERVRRERISERMKYLQELVPGCNKITGKAGMLDEIINYVQSLQRQVEFLSMKLAAVNPAMDFNVDNLFSREMNPVCNSNSIPIMSTAPEQLESPYIPFNAIQQANACDMLMNAPEMGLRRTVSAPVGVLAADALLGSWFNVHGSSAWDSSLHNIYNVEFQQGRVSSFPVQSLPGKELPQNMKTEM